MLISKRVTLISNAQVKSNRQNYAVGCNVFEWPTKEKFKEIM